MPEEFASPAEYKELIRAAAGLKTEQAKTTEREEIARQRKELEADRPRRSELKRVFSLKVNPIISETATLVNAALYDSPYKLQEMVNLKLADETLFRRGFRMTLNEGIYESRAPFSSVMPQLHFVLTSAEQVLIEIDLSEYTFDKFRRGQFWQESLSAIKSKVANSGIQYAGALANFEAEKIIPSSFRNYVALGVAEHQAAGVM